MKPFNDKIAVVGDLHIGIHQADIKWHQTSINYANWLKKILKKNKIKDIVFLGDINDNRKVIPVTSLYWLPEFFKILSDFNIVIIAGNHDCYYNNRSDITSLNSLDQWKNITVVNEITSITKDDKVLTFCPWYSDFDKIPKSDILFGHFEISSFKLTNYFVCDFGIETSKMLDKFNLIMSGHFHIREERQYGDKRIIYTGSAYELTWGDLGNTKGLYLLDLENLSTQFIENNISPKHKRLNIKELLTAGKITKDIEKEIENNIINIIVEVNDLKNPLTEDLISKIYELNAFEIKTDYSAGQTNSLSVNNSITHIDVKDNMIEYIENLKPADKDSYTRLLSNIKTYIIDAYERAQNEK